MPSLRRVAAQLELSVALLPTGLFAGPNARAMDARFAEYAWTNDQRIARLTGQPFSQRYRDRILGDAATAFDSGPAIVALTAVAQLAPDEELRALEAVQVARWVEGRDVTSPSVLADVLRGLGLVVAAERLADPGAGVKAAAASRMSAGRALLHEVGASGVPTLLVGDGARRRAVPSNLLYGRFDELEQHLRSTGVRLQPMTGGLA